MQKAYTLYPNKPELLSSQIITMNALSEKNNNIINQNSFQALERLAYGSPLKRLLNNPFKYLFAQVFRKLLYKKITGPLHVTTRTFWGKKISLLLPAGTDIYLTGGKSDPSEIRLSKYVIKNLSPSSVVFDIGAHYGFYSLLFSELTGKHGKVYSFEASPSSFKILQKNLKSESNAECFHAIISDCENEVTFYEYETLYSEYNTLDDAQYSGQDWRKKTNVTTLSMQAITLDRFAEKRNTTPTFIKVDVEGGEFKVLSGAVKILASGSCIVAMEFLNKSRNNTNHLKAVDLLLNLGYKPHSINKNGDPELIDNVTDYFEKNNLVSDNIIFRS